VSIISLDVLLVELVKVFGYVELNQHYWSFGGLKGMENAISKNMLSRI
jgi:hypothetical protein